MNKNRISKRDHDLFNLALRVAEDSDCSDRHGTVIVRGGAVLAVAANRFTGNPTSARWLKRTVHSEQRAILRLGPNASGATLYTARLHRNRLSRPCLMCRALLEEAGINTVVYYSLQELVKERVT